MTKSAYYYNAVLWAYINEITEGMTETTFGPTSTVTRAQAVTFIWRAAGCPTPGKTSCDFTDIDVNAYYYTALLWAIEKNLVNGISETEFDPDGLCVNAHILTMLYRVMTGKIGTLGENSWYEEAIAWAKTNGLLDDTYTGDFSALNNCPRCNVVEYLYRYYAK